MQLSGKRRWQRLEGSFILTKGENYVRPNNDFNFTARRSTTTVDEIISTSYARLDPHNNGLIIAHLKPLVIDLEARQGDKGQDMVVINQKDIDAVPKMDIIFSSNALEKYDAFKKYQPERLNPEDAIIPSYYGNKFCTRCKEENCICDSPNPDNK